MRSCSSAERISGATRSAFCRGDGIVKSGSAEPRRYFRLSALGRSLGALHGFGAEAAETPLPAAVVLERAPKAALIEVGPQAIAEMQLREGGFPQQKITESPLAAGADQQIHFRRHRRQCVILDKADRASAPSGHCRP